MEEGIIVIINSFWWASGSFQLYLPSLSLVRPLRSSLGHGDGHDPCQGPSEVALGWGRCTLWGTQGVLGIPTRPPPDTAPPGGWQGSLSLESPPRRRGPSYCICH